MYRKYKKKLFYILSNNKKKKKKKKKTEEKYRNCIHFLFFILCYDELDIFHL